MGVEKVGKSINTEPFYHLNSSGVNEAGVLQFDISILPDHPVFAGHFPGLPVVPGVMMLQTVRYLLDEYFNKKFRFVSAGNIKFISLITPTENGNLQIEVKLRNNEEQIITSIVIKSGATLCLKMDSTYVAA